MGQVNCCSQSNGADESANLQIGQIDYNQSSSYVKLQKMAQEITTDANIPAQYNQLIQRIIVSNQEHVLEVLKSPLTPEKRSNFITNLEIVDFEMMDSVKRYNELELYHTQFKKRDQKLPQALPCNIQIKDTCQNTEAGMRLLSEGKVGIVLLAGGRSERYEGLSNKLISDVGLPSKKSPLKLMFEKLRKILIQGIELGTKLATEQIVLTEKIKIFILLNDYNSYEVKSYLQQNKCFEFPISTIQFCYQRTNPIVDLEGHLVFQDDIKPFVTSTGTGLVFEGLQYIKFQEKIVESGVEYLHFLGCENLLAQPLDPNMLGILEETGADIVCKVCDQYIPEQPSIKQIGPEFFLTMDETTKDNQTNSSSNETPEVLLHCLNDMMITTSFLKRMTKDQERSLQYLSKWEIIKRQRSCYNHKTMQYFPCETVQYERMIQQIIEVADEVVLYKIPEDQCNPVIKNCNFQKEKANPYVVKQSQVHKKWLKMENTCESDVLEIQPHTSLKGEGLEALIEQFQEKTPQFPLII